MKGLIAVSLALWAVTAGCDGDPTWSAKSCPQIGQALSERTDECFPQVHAAFSYVNEPGLIYRLWNQYGVCGILADSNGVIAASTLNDIRVCAEWIVEQDCSELSDKLRQILVDKKAKFPHPSECDFLFLAIRSGIGL